MKTITKGKFEISQFQAADCARKNAISPKVFNRFSKTFLLLKDVENRYLSRKFHWRSYFSFSMVRWNLFQVEKFQISHFQAVQCFRKNAISPKVFNRFSKTFLLLKDVENRYLSRKFHCRSYFSFSMVRWKLYSGGKIPNFPLSSCTLCQKKYYITKGIQPIFKNVSSAERCGK